MGNFRSLLGTCDIIGEINQKQQNDYFINVYQIMLSRSNKEQAVELDACLMI